MLTPSREHATRPMVTDFGLAGLRDAVAHVGFHVVVGQAEAGAHWGVQIVWIDGRLELVDEHRDVEQVEIRHLAPREVAEPCRVAQLVPRRRLNVSIQRAVLHRQAERAAPRAKRAAVEIGFANECFVHTDKI
jgi:hypothetical protein